jgi:hypothetical protein
MAPKHVVICACGQSNRIKDQRGKRGWFSCGKCGRRLKISPNTTSTGLTRWIGWGLLLVMAGGAMAGIYLAKPPGAQMTNPTVQTTLPANPAVYGETLRREPDSNVSPRQSGPAIPQVPGPAPFPREPTWIEATRPDPNLGRPAVGDAVPDPGRHAPSPRDQVAQPTQPQTPQLSPIPVKNGVLRQRKGESAVAGLRIETPPSADYVLKLVNIRDGKEEMLIYVHRGSTFETKIPLGAYKINGAYGETWYGEKYLFGPERTSFIRLVQKDGKSDQFTFYRSGNRTKGYVVHGFDIHLTQQISGNLETQNIRAEEF